MQPPPNFFFLSNPWGSLGLSGALWGLTHRTWHLTGLDKPDRTGQPTGTRSPFELGLEAEASSGHDKESGALAGSLSNRFNFRDKEAGGWESTTRGAACPRQVSMEKTDMKCSGTPGRDVWTGSTGTRWRPAILRFGWAADGGGDLPRTEGLGEPRMAASISCKWFILKLKAVL